MISAVSKVVVPVDDQERAKEFWVDRLGFELRRDESYGDERWIEHFGWWALFADPDGTRYALGQWD
jgi:catechol 2,3-dioxygenase-like lactoylglutathione lyase family enzyme